MTWESVSGPDCRGGYAWEGQATPYSHGACYITLVKGIIALFHAGATVYDHIIALQPDMSRKAGGVLVF